MGCRLSKLTSLPTLLTKDESNVLVKKIWANVCEKYYDEVGICFMVRLFQGYPQLRKLWIFATNLETEAEMRSNPQVQYHAAKVMHTLNELISNIDDYDKRQRILESLGRIHFNYDVQPSNFLVAKSTMDLVLSSTLKENFTHRQKQAWSLFFQQIILDLGKGVEHQAALDLSCVEKSNIIKIGSV